MVMTEKEQLTTTIQRAKAKGFTDEQIYEIIASALDNAEPPKPKCIEKTNIELRVTEALREMGIPAHIKGFRYVRTAIKLVYEDPTLIERVTKALYPTVAHMHDTTSSRVERAIRHAIETAWERGNVEVLTKYFGYTTDKERGKPTNSEFISMIADELLLEDKSN